MPILSEAALCNMALGYAGVNARINSLDDPSAAARACKTYYEQLRDDMLSNFSWPFAIRRADLTPYSGVVYDATHIYAQGDLVSYGSIVYRSLRDANLGVTPGTSPVWWFQITRGGFSYVCPMPDDFINLISVYSKPNIGGSSAQSFAPLRAPRSEQRAPFQVEDANDGSGLSVLLTDLDHPVLRYTARITNTMSFSTSFVTALVWALAPPLCFALRADPKAATMLKQLADKEMGEAITAEQRSEREDPEPVSEFEAFRES